MEKFLEGLFIYILSFLVMMLPALFIMVFQGALADDFGWRTYGFWHVYQALIVLWHVASVVFFPITLRLAKLQEALND